MYGGGERPFILLPNGNAILNPDSWHSIPVSDRDVLMYSLGAANQAAPGMLMSLLASGARLDTAVYFILRGIGVFPVEPWYQGLAPHFPASPLPCARMHGFNDCVGHYW
jgi:hypothetical protein